MSPAPTLISVHSTDFHSALPLPLHHVQVLLQVPKGSRYSPSTRLHPLPDQPFQSDPKDDTKPIKELKDGNTGLPFNMEYSAIAAMVDALKDPNAVDDRKMLVSHSARIEHET